MAESRLPAWVAQHPVTWAIVTGSAATLIGLGLFGTSAWPLAVTIGVVFGGLNGWMWRPKGPAHRWRAHLLERFPRR